MAKMLIVELEPLTPDEIKHLAKLTGKIAALDTDKPPFDIPCRTKGGTLVCVRSEDVISEK